MSLATFVEISKALSIAAIPVVLAIVGFVVQRQLAQQSLRKEYVSLALSILREPDSTKVEPELRAWAVDLLNLNSDVKFDEKTTQRLKSGETRLPSNFVGAGLTSTREQELTSFQRFLAGAGFNIAPGRIGYDIWPGDFIEYSGDKYTALYDPDTSTIRIASKYAESADVAFHELMRRVLLRPEVTQSYSLGALNSGLAVYFPCSFSGRTTYAAATDLQIDLRQQSRLDVPMQADANASYDFGSNNWAAAFWALRERIGAQTIDKLLARVWSTWQPPRHEHDVFASFGRALVDADPEHAAEVREVLLARGLKLGSPRRH